MKQGQSRYTRAKIDHFGDMFSLNIKLVEQIRKKYSWNIVYNHFDLYAGSGYNDEANCEGSPMAFARAALDSGFGRFNAHFVEKDKERAALLKSRLIEFELPGFFRWKVHCLDNAKFLTERLKLMLPGRPEWQFGTILLDANGYTYPLDEITRAALNYPRLDLLINYPATAPLWGGRRKYLATEILPLKSDWVVTEPHGPWKWHRLMGRNKRYNPMSGWYCKHSTRGRDILRDADRTKADRKSEEEEKQLKLGV